MPSIARGLTSAGAITWVKPAVARLLHGQVDQRQLQLGADPGEEVEPRPRTPSRHGRGRWRRASGRARCGRAARSPQPRSRGGCPPSRGRRSRPRRRPAPRRPPRWGSTSAPLRHSSSAAAWAASASLTSAASALVRASSSAFSSPCGLRDQLAQLLLLGPPGLERRRWRRGGLRRRRAPGPRRPRTGRAWPGRRAHGRGRLGAGGDRSWVQAIGRPASRAPQLARHTSPQNANHLARARSRTDSRVLDRSRLVTLAWAAVCLVLLLVLAVLVGRRRRLGAVAGRGRPGRGRLGPRARPAASTRCWWSRWPSTPSGWRCSPSRSRPGCGAKGYHRAAYFTLGVMLATPLAYHRAEVAGRARPAGRGRTPSPSSGATRSPPRTRRGRRRTPGS